jgi:hypothetical protein
MLAAAAHDLFGDRVGYPRAQGDIDLAYCRGGGSTAFCLRKKATPFDGLRHGVAEQLVGNPRQVFCTHLALDKIQIQALQAG